MSSVPITDGVRLEEVDASVEVKPFCDIQRADEFETVVVADAEVLWTAVRNITYNCSEMACHVSAMTIICCEVDITFIPETKI